MGRAAKVQSFFESAMTDFTEQLQYSNMQKYLLQYKKLLNVQKDTFESTHKTVEKLKYAESCGVSVNDIFYLLGILYNDVEHTWSNGIDKPAIYKLENLVVRKFISDIFDFKGDSIKIDSNKLL